uniref:Uncharacterized protein n=1 Tax=Kalanchoe fedtschenkoi TaxID=63787 RepID=A0A7N0VG02_KALFE
MGNVPTCGVTGDEHVSKISHASQPCVWTVCHCLILQPLYRAEPILDCCGEAVLRRQPVVGCNDHGLQVFAKAEAVVLAVGPSTGADAEAAAVDVVEDGERGRGGGVGWLVEAELEVVGGVEDHVFPENGAVIVDRDGEARMGGADDGAIAVDSENAPAFIYFMRKTGADGNGGCGGFRWEGERFVIGV